MTKWKIAWTRGHSGGTWSYTTYEDAMTMYEYCLKTYNEPWERFALYEVLSEFGEDGEE